MISLLVWYAFVFIRDGFLQYQTLLGGLLLLLTFLILHIKQNIGRVRIKYFGTIYLIPYDIICKNKKRVHFSGP